MDFTPSGLWQLATALPELTQLEGDFRQAMAAAGYTYDFPDYGGVRTDAQTAQLIAWRDQAVAKGEPYYRVSPADTSYHNRGAAFDIKITTPANPTQADYHAAAEIGESVGLTAGYYFSAPNDPYHFQLDYDLDTVTQMWTDHLASLVSGEAAVQAVSDATGIPPAALLVAGGIFLTWLFTRGRT